MNKITQVLFSWYSLLLSIKIAAGCPELADIDAKNAIIKTRNISGLNLKGIKSIGEDLSRIDFAKVGLNEAIFLGTNLTGSDFTDAIITGANFFGSILIDTKFNGADFTGTQNLHHAIYKRCHTFPLSLLYWWEYNKDNLDIQQITQLLSAGFTICQARYSEDELELISKFKKR